MIRLTTASPLTRVFEAGQLLRPKRVDLSTSVGRARERERRFALTTIASVVARVASLLTSLITVRVALLHLGAESYGLWMTMSGLLALFVFADLGIGNGLINSVSTAHGKDQQEAARKAIGNALVLMCVIALAWGTLFLAVYSFVPWPDVFNVQPPASNLIGPTLMLLAAFVLIGLPLSVVDKVRLGYQEDFINSAWSCAASLCGLSALLVAVALNASLPWLVFSAAFAPALTRLANAVVLFGYRRPWLRPSFADINTESMRNLVRIGGFFFVLQVCMAVAFNSDILILAQVVGTNAVAEYSVVNRLFGLVPMFTSMALLPLWPAYTEALARGDSGWVRRTLTRSLRLSAMITIPAAIALVAFGPHLLDLWVGSKFEPSLLLFAGFGVWIVLSTAGNAVAMFLNGAYILRFQAAVALVMAIVNICLSVFLTKVLGTPGVIWGTVIAYSVCACIPMALYVPKKLATLSTQDGAKSNA